MSHPTLRPKDCRHCPACQIVTRFHNCPLCNLATNPHPDRDDEDTYCSNCAEPVSANEAHVKDWGENPFEQTDDGDLIMVCPECRNRGGDT